ncbi:MAG: gamma carbonic anhydrase family protein [Rhodospirillaceae bacterium]
MIGNIQSFRGHTPKIAGDAFIASTAVIIGDVEVGARSSVWYHCVVRGNLNAIRIGADTNIQDGTVIHVSRNTYGTVIGDGVTAGHLCLIHACTLEDHCMVGMQATVMDGCVIESGALLAAGSLLPPGKRIPAGQFWAGSPARHVGPVKEGHQAMLDRIWPGYAELGAEFRAKGLDLRDLADDGDT